MLAGRLLGDFWSEEGPSEKRGLLAHKSSIRKTQRVALDSIFNLGNNEDS